MKTVFIRKAIQSRSMNLEGEFIKEKCLVRL